MQMHEKLKTSQDMLPSWNDTSSKKTIIEFVTCVTEKGSPDFVPPVERFAVFDNDGTLWSEQPFYVQGIFVFERVRGLDEGLKHGWTMISMKNDWKAVYPFELVPAGKEKGRQA